MSVSNASNILDTVSDRDDVPSHCTFEALIPADLSLEQARSPLLAMLKNAVAAVLLGVPSRAYRRLSIFLLSACTGRRTATIATVNNRLRLFDYVNTDLIDDEHGPDHVERRQTVQPAQRVVPVVQVHVRFDLYGHVPAHESVEPGRTKIPL